MGVPSRCLGVYVTPAEMCNIRLPAMSNDEPIANRCWGSHERVTTITNSSWYYIFLVKRSLARRKHGTTSLRSGVVGMRGHWSLAMACVIMITPSPLAPHPPPVPLTIIWRVFVRPFGVAALGAIRIDKSPPSYRPPRETVRDIQATFKFQAGMGANMILAVVSSFIVSYWASKFVVGKNTSHVRKKN